MKKIGIFCVGSGGHVLPAKNIIKELIDEGIDKKSFVVVTDKRGAEYFENMELKLYTESIYRSNKGILGYILNFHKIIKSIIKIKNIIIKENIKVIFSTGSYIAPVASLLSFIFKIQYFGQEQNIYAGLGNKFSSFFPGLIFTSYMDTKNLLSKNIKFVGPIINKELNKVNKEKKDIVIGVQGGSQGSEEINNYVYKFLNNNKLSNVSFIHITGKNKSNNNYKYENYKQYEFIEDMNFYYSNISIQISRAGGGSLEAAFLEIPQILIPYKYGTTSSHQSLNAEYLNNLGVAELVNSYNEFEETLITILTNFNKWKKNNFNKVNIESGNKVICKYLMEAHYE
tara:strand:+ start:7702 stop:8724 length:1023 start_codon:yes stop_codon:yes gene_type:complete